MLQAECLTIGSWEKSRWINSLFFPPFPELVQDFSQWGDLPGSQCTQLLWLFQACHEADCVLSPCITSHSSLPCVPFLILNAPGFCHPNKTLILKKKKNYISQNPILLVHRLIASYHQTRDLEGRFEDYEHQALLT